jgi:hypothetical protein
VCAAGASWRAGLGRCVRGGPRSRASQTALARPEQRKRECGAVCGSRRCRWSRGAAAVRAGERRHHGGRLRLANRARERLKRELIRRDAGELASSEHGSWSSMV